MQNGTELLALRFLLGLIDGGVWTMILVVLARWFPGKERATANSIWLTCLPLSFIIMGPISGLLISAFNWRALFIIEGLPAILLGIAYLPDRRAGRRKPPGSPAPSATMFSPDAGGPARGDRRRVSGSDLRSARPADERHLLFLARRRGGLVHVAAGDHQVPVEPGIMATGYLSTLPYIAAMGGLLVVGRVSDRTGQRARLVCLTLFCLGFFLLLSVGRP